MDPTVQTAIVGAVAAIAVAAFGAYGNKRLNQQDQKLKAVHHQVANSHETNLRDDLDRVIDGIETLVEGQRRHDEEIAGLRDDFRIERQERLALARWFSRD